MKHLLTLTFAASLALFSFTFTACKKDPCKDVQCQNSGVCVEGTCDCPVPYEGTVCDVRMTAKFEGQFAGTIECFGQTDPETFVITESQTHIDRILISDGDITFYGVMTSSTTFNIPSQTFDDGGITVTLTGNGSLVGNELSMTMTATVSGFPVTCTFSGTRQ